MTIKNFVFKETGGVRWLVWKQHFFVIFDLIWTHILALKGPKMNCLNSILVKKDINYIIINYVTD